jgi:hypothetical protein
MFKRGLPIIFIVVISLCFSYVAYSQQPISNSDTFFLVKKKGFLGTIGKSISKFGDDPEPIKIINPYISHKGKIIRSIRVIRLGFERDFNDTNRINRSFGVIIANAFHKKTAERVISNNLFFEVGDPVNPFLLSDNERHLREQPFLQDALIKIETLKATADSVDILILTKEVFSLGVAVDIASTTRYKVDLKEENIAGSGSRLLLSSFYDESRNPKFGYGAEYLNRNLRGSFINWTVGFQTFKSTFNTGRNEEATFYTKIEKPLVSPYIPWIGALDLSYNATNNTYSPDSLYKSDFRYTYKNIDGWFGYNFGAKRLLKDNKQSRVRKFVAARGLYQRFIDLPDRVRSTFDYRYTNISGILGSINIFEQNFYRTNFIYGFGRYEDVPEGFSASIIGGITNKKDSISLNSRIRPYYALEGQRSKFNKKGFFSTYTLKIGGFYFNHKWEDVDLLLNVDHFTRLKKIGLNWYYRHFYSLGFTRQITPVLNQPLYLQSNFGLPYFNNGFINADFRATAKTESVFYNLTKFWGFRFAPFLFADACVIKPTNKPYGESQFFGAIGAGVRTRNENLIFGTIELKGYYFPKTVGDMAKWRVEVGTNIRFKYSSVFIKKPDFIVAN